MTVRILAVTMGDPAGIGGALTVQAWRALRATGPTFVALDDPERLAAIDPSLPLRVVTSPEQAAPVFAEALPVLPVRVAGDAPGDAKAAAAIASIELAGRLAVERAVAGLVTNPVSKTTLRVGGFAYPGHTEFLGAITGAPAPVMMLACPALRVVPVTIHLSLREAIAALNPAAIIGVARTTAAALRQDFGIANPRLAVTGLNPHAGEQGVMGAEEGDIIAPAVAALQAEGVLASGPWSPDTMFTPAARARYDVAICMVHDQALIPVKTLDMARAVNVTLGLPIIRTSPDHGSAFDIAGEGRGDPVSLLESIRLAARLAERRRDAV